jgi:hypothetical protein
MRFDKTIRLDQVGSALGAGESPESAARWSRRAQATDESLVVDHNPTVVSPGNFAASRYVDDGDREVHPSPFYGRNQSFSFDQAAYWSRSGMGELCTEADGGLARFNSMGNGLYCCFFH